MSRGRPEVLVVYPVVVESGCQEFWLIERQFLKWQRTPPWGLLKVLQASGDDQHMHQRSRSGRDPAWRDVQD